MSHLNVYYPECSQNEQNRINRELKKENQKLLEANEALEERILLARVDRLPNVLQRLVGEFSVVVKEQMALVKLEFFDRWVIENTGRIMGLVEGWTKPHVGFVLNSIIQLEYPNFDGYLKGEPCYQHWDAKYMRKQIKVYISHRTQIMRPDILEDLRHQRTYTVHKFVPCRVNTAFDECPPIRVYGAYKAIEEYDTRMNSKKTKGKSKK
jgi:hypothetical protein